MNDSDFILLGNLSLHKDGGYAPGAWAYYFYKGNIIWVYNFRCFYQGFDTNCADSRIKGLSKDELVSLYEVEIEGAKAAIDKRCGANQL